MAGRVAAPLGFGRRRKRFANRVERLEIRRGIRPRRASDGRLVHKHDFFEMRVALDAVACIYHFRDARVLGFRNDGPAVRLCGFFDPQQVGALRLQTIL